MKIKKIQLVRLEYIIETNRPALAKAKLFFYFPKLCVIKRINFRINIAKQFGYADCGTVYLKKVLVIGVPKIKVAYTE